MPCVHRARASLAARHTNVFVARKEIALRVAVQRCINAISAKRAPTPVGCNRTRVTWIDRAWPGHPTSHPDVFAACEEIALRAAIQRGIYTFGTEGTPAPIGRNRPLIARVHD